MAQQEEDATCIRLIMERFKNKASPNRLTVVEDADRNRPVATKLDFDMDSFDAEGDVSVKKRKCSPNGSPAVSNASKYDASISVTNTIDSPWEMRHIKRELIDAKAKIATLETRVGQLHALRQEMEVVFEAEKNSFLQQQERDQMTIHTLENRVAQLRKRESDTRDANVYKLKDIEDQNFSLEKSIHTLRREKCQLSDELLELKRLFRNAESKNQEYEAEIMQLKNTINSNNQEKQSSSPPSDSMQLSLQNERLVCELREAQRTVKDLECKLEDCLEASVNVKAQHHKLMKIPEMERELETLRSDVVKLRDIVHNKLLLEEEVVDLRQKCASSDEQIKRLVELEAQQQLLESRLFEWKELVQDFCTSTPDDNVCPSVLRLRLQELQQTELLLSAEVADLQTKLKSSANETSKAQAEISRLTLEVSRLKTTQEQQGNLIRRWQKKLALVTGERNSYREQLDSYEKELTVSVSNLQQTSRPRIEALEKSLEGYRELVSNLEADLASALGQGGSRGLLEKIRVVSAERDALLEKKQLLEKKLDEMQIQLENQALKGDYNPIASRVLHLRMNPIANAEEEREQEMTLLRTEVAKLRERIKVLQEGERDDVTCKVDSRLATSNLQEVQELREQIKSSELMMQRLKEAFKKTSSEFRDCIYTLLGYKVDRLQNKGGLFRLSSMYAESPDDYLLFKMEGNSTYTLLETSFSATIGDLIDVHLRQQGSLPVFHAAVTMDLFSRQSMVLPSASADDDDEQIVILD